MMVQFRLAAISVVALVVVGTSGPALADSSVRVALDHGQVACHGGRGQPSFVFVCLYEDWNFNGNSDRGILIVNAAEACGQWIDLRLYPLEDHDFARITSSYENRSFFSVGVYDTRARGNQLLFTIPPRSESRFVNREHPHSNDRADLIHIAC